MEKYVCYCNQVSEEDIQKALELEYARTIEELIEYTGAMKNSNCAVNNPKGTCCYSDIVAAFERYKLK